MKHDTAELDASAARGARSLPADVATVVYRTGRSANYASAGVALVLTAYAATRGVGVQGWAWCVAALAVFAYRGHLLERHRLAPHSRSSVRWLAQFERTVLLNGVTWGAAGFVFGGAGDLTLSVIVAAVLCGLFAGAIMTYFVHPRAIFLFAIPAISPFALFLIA
ncbi:MAG: hypothetical protein ACU85V_09600, partial [Gammaproteobacteria bacterium]